MTKNLKKRFLKPMLLVSVFLIILLSARQNAASQLKDITVSAGLVTSYIMANNPASMPIIPRESTPNGLGGGFTGNQPGFGFRVNFPLGKSENFVVPVGLDYIYFRALERVPLKPNPYTIFFIRHTISVPTPAIGLNYYMFKFPIANVRAFSGIEARGSFLNTAGLYERWEFVDHDSVVEKNGKENAFRLGGAFKLGFEGEFLKPWYVSASMSFDCLNLVGRNDSRGELLTPYNKYESGESFVWTFHIMFMIQYKFM